MRNQASDNKTIATACVSRTVSGQRPILQRAAMLALSAAIAMGTATLRAQTAAQASDTAAQTSEARQAAQQQAIEQLQKKLEDMQAELNHLKAASLANPAPNTAAQPATPATATAGTSTSNAGNQQPTTAKASAPVEPAKEDLMAVAAVDTTGPHSDPFAFGDFTWLNGNPRTKDTPYATKFFTPEIRVDANYTYDFRHPKDDTIGGSSEIFRANEVQLTQLGVGGDFHYDQVRARVMTQFGLYSQTTPRNDASPARGQWNLDNAYRYLSEAYGGYHFKVQHGVNVDAGIFMSYVGLFSYYQFDNWAYQPSYVSSNTPWFFNGVRVQWFPTNKLKIEPWFVNGWQSYGRFNSRPGIGGQILYRPTSKISILGNQYAVGRDTLGNGGRTRFHTDDSIEYKYLDRPNSTVSKAAFSVTGDLGCESGGGVSCFGNGKDGPKQSFLGYMIYNRLWFNHDKYAMTLGGGGITNPGRYLVLLPPINGATAASGSPYFTQNPGDPYKAWDASVTGDYMPSQYFTYRLEYNHRSANVPYFSGPGGLTPPGGNTFGAPGSVVAGWAPDLRNSENRLTFAFLLKF